MKAKRTAKRRPAKRALVRGEPVVRGVLEAAMEELARVGYRALRVEDVAARAGVNKTTVYRRWPTKEELVRAALEASTSHRLVAPNTGSLRGDLLEVGRAIVEMFRSAEGQGLFRISLAEGPDSELMVIARSLRKAHEAVPRSVIEAAQARGEFAPYIDPMLLPNTFVAAIHHRLFADREEVDDDFLNCLLDLLLLGALTPLGREQRKATLGAA